MSGISIASVTAPHSIAQLRRERLSSLEKLAMQLGPDALLDTASSSSLQPEAVDILREAPHADTARGIPTSRKMSARTLERNMTELVDIMSGPREASSTEARDENNGTDGGDDGGTGSPTRQASHRPDEDGAAFTDSDSEHGDAADSEDHELIYDPELRMFFDPKRNCLQF